MAGDAQALPVAAIKPMRVAVLYVLHCTNVAHLRITHRLCLVGFAHVEDWDTHLQCPSAILDKTQLPRPMQSREEW